MEDVSLELGILDITTDDLDFSTIDGKILYSLKKSRYCPPERVPTCVKINETRNRSPKLHL